MDAIGVKRVNEVRTVNLQHVDIVFHRHVVMLNVSQLLFFSDRPALERNIYILYVRN